MTRSGHIVTITGDGRRIRFRQDRHDASTEGSLMPRLFTYILANDDGAAPNPFHGMCSLAICKPGIRRTAQPGDWIAGLGSKNARSGNLSGSLVYAMRVEEVLSLEDYDSQAPSRWPHRVPNPNSTLRQDHLGDCIYDFSSGTPVQRPGVHNLGNRDRDLGGRNVLLSRDFYYFGRQAPPLPESLQPIRHQNQGHRSTANAGYFQQFVDWVRSFPPAPGHLYGEPDWNEAASCGSGRCPTRRQCGGGNPV